jgi:hypothetical protein
MMNTVSRSPLRFAASPPAITVASIIIILGAQWLIGLRPRDGSAASDRLASTAQWTTWVFLAGFSVALFVVLFGLGVGLVLRPAPRWGLAETPRRRRYWYLAFAAAFVGALCYVMLLAKPYPAVTHIPVRHMVLRTRSVIVSGYIAMMPWVALVWLAHRECATIKQHLANLPAEGMAAEQPTTEPLQTAVDQLQRLWRLINACVGAAAAVVVVAIVTAGALRTTYLAFAPASKDDYPASVVLLFGGLYGTLLIAIGVPLAASWRARARDVLEHAYPLRLDTRRDERWAADRAQLEHLLHLDTGLIRSPLTALSVLTPLITSLLAVLVPGIAKP